MKHVLIISYSPLHRDPRILRQIEALKDLYKITALGYTDPKCDGVNYIQIEEVHYRSFKTAVPLALQLVFRQYEKSLLGRGNTNAIVSSDINKPDVIIANDWEGLFLAEKLIQNHSWDSKVYFDAHEYSPKQERNMFWKFGVGTRVKHVLRTCMGHVAMMTTVAEGIAREYEKYLSLPANSVDIITNAPNYEPELKPIQITVVEEGGGIDNPPWRSDTRAQD